MVKIALIIFAVLSTAILIGDSKTFTASPNDQIDHISNQQKVLQTKERLRMQVAVLNAHIDRQLVQIRKDAEALNCLLGFLNAVIRLSSYAKNNIEKEKTLLDLLTKRRKISQMLDQLTQVEYGYWVKKRWLQDVDHLIETCVKNANPNFSNS